MTQRDNLISSTARQHNNSAVYAVPEGSVSRKMMFLIIIVRCVHREAEEFWEAYDILNVDKRCFSLVSKKSVNFH